MPPAAPSTASDALGTSNRRQPVRQTRIQAPKYAFSKNHLGGNPSTGGAAEDRAQPPSEPGFYPALTHFTDSITALPKEMLKHFGMFKEVDSKIYGPEGNLKKLVKEVLAAPKPQPFAEASRAFELLSRPPSDIMSATNSVNGAGSVPIAPSSVQVSTTGQANGLEHHDLPRRQMFFDLRCLVTEMLPVLEEKNHVISSATDDLSKQLARCESSWPELEKEFSDETRWGNLHHWAYSDRSSEKKDTRVERPRREAAVHHNFAAVQDDFGAVRGTSKRRAQQAQIENEIEETRANKRALGAGKTKKPTANQASAVGLGLIAGPSNPPSKKRKPDEPVVANLPIERALSSVFSKTAANKGNTSPRSRSPAGAKRARAPGAAAANGKGRARAGTGASAANSPLIASSPVVGTFTATKPSASPAIGSAMQRQPSSRARQNSTQGALTPTSNPKPVNSNQNQVIHEAAATTVAKNPTRTPKPESYDEPETRLAAVKREDSSASRHRPPNISTGTRASGKASKNATPVHASFADAPGGPRPRSNRTTQAAESNGHRNGGGGAGSPAIPTAPKRSHKKSASVSAIQQREETAARVTVNPATGPAGQDGADDAADDEDEGNGERYCYCGGPSYGDMVGCDGDGCPREWFHLDCIGLSKIPAGKAKWYCEECKKRLKIS